MRYCWSERKQEKKKLLNKSIRENEMKKKYKILCTREKRSELLKISVEKWWGIEFCAVNIRFLSQLRCVYITERCDSYVHFISMYCKRKKQSSRRL
jgi:hypothetical protein